MVEKKLRVVLIKPSKYRANGMVERFSWGFMPNATLAHISSLTPQQVGEVRCEVLAIDEYIQTDLQYLVDLRKQEDSITLVAIVGVQSHQFHRALDLAVYAKAHGVEHCVIGGPHPMTCDTSGLHERGISFSLAEAESVWPMILQDAIHGELRASYGAENRWHHVLDPPVLRPFSKRVMRRYSIPIMGIYPARGCPYTCNFCSVIKIAGRQVRSQPVATTVASLRAARDAGIRMVMFTSDNFNKYPEATELLQEIIEENIRVPFFVQCDAQIYKQPELIEMLGKAGCFQMFVGVESFSREELRAARKFQNAPEYYSEIASLCREHGITSHFSNILGFPGDTEKSILEHLEMLRAINPDVASFYILTPIPGTQQYDEFLDQDLIFERNLDRFDGIELTWSHPHLSAADLQRLLMKCYRKFFNNRAVASKIASVLRAPWDFRMLSRFVAVPGYSVKSRLAAMKNDHPMSGGIFRHNIDRETDYLHLRRKILGVDRVGLPKSLQLSAADEELNRHARL